MTFKKLQKECVLGYIPFEIFMIVSSSNEFVIVAFSKITFK